MPGLLLYFLNKLAFTVWIPLEFFFAGNPRTLPWGVDGNPFPVTVLATSEAGAGGFLEPMRSKVAVSCVHATAFQPG